MSDSSSPIDQLSTSQSNKELRVNELVDAASPALTYGRRAATTTGLTWGYYGGRDGGTAVANGTVTLTGSNTNYVVVHRTTKAVSTSTSATNWNDTTTYGRLYKVVTGASSVSSYEDHRFGEGGVPAGATPAEEVGASDIEIVDQGDYYPSDKDLESVLQHVGALLDHILSSNFSGGGGGGGGGSGTKTYGVFTPMTSQPPASNFATLDTRNSIAVLDFDDTTEESVFWTGVMPEAASLGSGLKVRIHWTATTATTGQVRWGVQFERAGTDLDSDSYDTAAEAHSTTNGTSGIETVTEITITTIDSIAAGDRYRMKVYRDSSDTTNDTMTGDAELVAVEVRSAA